MSTSPRKSNANLRDRDLAHFIHPLHNRAVHENAHVWVRGNGAILTNADGREFIDGLAGLWNVTAGHGRTELADAMHGQASTLAYASGYSGSSNQPAIELARQTLQPRWLCSESAPPEQLFPACVFFLRKGRAGP